MRSVATGLCLTAVLGFSQASNAGTIRHDTNDSQYTSLAADAKYASVGGFLSKDNANDAAFTGLASGVLIAPQWVLTAAHVTDLPQTGAMSFRFGSSITSPTATYAADSWVSHPLWTGSLQNGYDIGLVHLSTPVVGVTPATLYAGTSEKGLTSTHVGYGKTGTGVTGGTLAAGTRRAGNNTLDNVGGETSSVGLDLTAYNSRVIFTDFDSPISTADSSMGVSSPLALEYLVAPGDSGGGLFIDVGGVTYLAGVTSFLAAFDGNANADYGDIGGFTRVQPFSAWINTTIPEPASSTLLAMIGGLMLTRRRR